MVPRKGFICMLKIRECKKCGGLLMKRYIALFIIMIIIGIIPFASSIYNRKKNSTLAFDFFMSDWYFYGDNVNCYDTMYRIFYNIAKFSFGERIECVFFI